MSKMFLKRVPVRVGLVTAFVILLMGLVEVELAQYNQYRRLAERYNTITGTSVEKLSLLINLRRGSDYVQTNVLHLLLTKNPGELAATRKKIQLEVEKNDTNIHEFEQLLVAAQEKIWFDSLLYYRQFNDQMRTSLIKNTMQGKFNEARQYYLDSQHISFELLQHANTMLTSFVKDSANHQKSLLNNTIEADNKKALEINGIIILLLLFMGVAVFRTLQKMRDDHLQIMKSEAKYRFLAEHTNEIINRCDATGKILFANPAFKTKLGYDDAEIAQLSIPDILDEESLHTFQFNPDPEKLGTLIKNVQKTYIAKSGQKVMVEGNIIIEYKNHKCVAAEAYFNDVTEKVLLQQQLKASEKKYRSMFELSLLPKLIYDIKSYKIVQVNPAAIMHYGYNEVEWQSKKITDIIEVHYLPEAKAALHKWQQKSEAYTSTMKHITKSGQIIDVEVRGVPFEYEGRPARLITILDVTERNQTENRISKAILDTQEQERFQISAELHDNVNQILTGAVFTLGLLKKNALSANQKEAITSAHQYIRLAIEAIRKISHRLAPPSFNLVDFEDSIKILLNGINHNNKYVIEYVCNLPKDRKLAEDLLLNLYRILQEQLNNIQKYADATHIKVRLHTNGKNVELYIADNGKGFDMEKVGNGIGLGNMQRRAALFSGYFQISSSPGNGCSVKVSIRIS